MANAIQSFHDSFACIKFGPEYICTVISCGTDHQLQSVMIINTVHQVHKNLLNVCKTGKATDCSVENTEWVSSTCHQNIL